jgi:arabinofuranosyltransferase
VTVKLHGSIGLRGFFSGPQVHLVDYYGITDPLLARLPAVYKAQWRIGHFFRHTPEGYLETLQTQTPSFKDPQTAAYYTLLQSATRAPLYSFERWIHIFLLHFVSPSLSQPFYRFPYIKETSLEELSVRKATGTPWNQKGNIGFAHEACLQIHFPKKQYIQSLEISVDASNNYKILFLQGEKILGNIFITTPPPRRNPRCRSNSTPRLPLP